MAKTYKIQGVPDENLQFQMAITQKLSLFDPLVGKAKMSLRTIQFF